MKSERQDRLRAHSKKKENTCDKCYYVDSEDDGYNFTGGSEWYECKRYPPTMIKSIDSDDGDVWTSYPNVSLDNWCGEFKPEE